MARNSWRSCKTQWLQQMDQEIARAYAAHQQTNRIRERRVTKKNQLEKAVDVFAAKYHLKPEDVKELLHEQLMSGAKYREKIELELPKICEDDLDVLDKYLIPSAACPPSKDLLVDASFANGQGY
ncbi:hypothetical protein B0H13DRAFT_2300478 [Mycena leptocephala]|nr:hypothetical protein B0H13DRAFT_2300478 [Mycena leptocephala]